MRHVGQDIHSNESGYSKLMEDLYDEPGFVRDIMRDNETEVNYGMPLKEVRKIVEKFEKQRKSSETSQNPIAPDHTKDNGGALTSLAATKIEQKKEADVPQSKIASSVNPLQRAINENYQRVYDKNPDILAEESGMPLSTVKKILNENRQIPENIRALLQYFIDNRGKIEDLDELSERFKVSLPKLRSILSELHRLPNGVPDRSNNRRTISPL